MPERRKPVKPKRLSREPSGEHRNSGAGMQKSENGRARPAFSQQPAELLPGKVSPDLTVNLDFLKQVFLDAPDFILREIPLAGECRGRLAVAYIDGLVNYDMVNRDILAPIIFAGGSPGFCLEDNPGASTAKMKKSSEMQDVLYAIFTGLAVVLVDGLDKAYLFDVIQYTARPVEKPATESTVRGPQEAFTEVLRVNITQLRRRLKDPDLKIKLYKMGERTQTQVALFYIRDLASPDILRRIEQRLQGISIDGILDVSYIEQIISDHPNSVFPQALTVERPDRVVASLLEGRVAVMVDGSPFALILPATLWQMFQSPDDYYQRWIMASFIRLLRFGAVFVALMLPAVYIAVVNYHYEVIPSELIIPIAQDRSRIPYGPLVEVLMMELALEVLRETGLRIPGTLGPTISIVGGLVIGDAAVRANLVSPIMVIVVAITALSSLTIPSFDTAYGIRLMRFVFTFMSALLGGFGIAVVFYLMLISIALMQSQGKPFYAPLMPAVYSEWKDTIVRLPFRLLGRRPGTADPLDSQRLKPEKRGGGK